MREMVWMKILSPKSVSSPGNVVCGVLRPLRVSLASHTFHCCYNRLRILQLQWVQVAMSYAAFKMVHCPTGVDTCVAAYVTHSAGETDSDSAPLLLPGAELIASGGYWATTPRDASGGSGLPPNLVITKANVLEVFHVRLLEGDDSTANGSHDVGNPETTPRGGLMAGLSYVKLELACHYRLHGNVESLGVLSYRRDEGRKGRDAVILTFRDAKVSVLEFDDSTHGLRIGSLHYFEGPEWQYLKRGRERFARGPSVRADPLGRCAGVLVYNSQLVLLKASQAGYGLGDEDESLSMGGKLCAHVASSYIVNLRDMDMKHIKDFVFLHGYIEPVLVVLHEKDPTWAGRVAIRRHTCAITALSINTTLKQHPHIWSATSLPYDAYKLLAVPAPIGGVIVFCANSLHYHSQSGSCALGLNEFAVAPEGSAEYPKSKLSVELDTAQATWVAHDVALVSTKTGMLLFLSLVYEARSVQRLELSKSMASVLTSCMCTIGDNFFFLGSRLADSLLVQHTLGSASARTPSAMVKIEREEGDTETDLADPAAKRLKREPSDDGEEGVSAEEMSLYYSSPTSSDTSQKKTFTFTVRDSLVNICPLRDFAYGLRSNADPDASGLSKQSNYEMVACSGHGKNGSLSVLHQSIRPELITEVEITGCSGIWTVYHKAERDDATEFDFGTTETEEFHAYLIISLESKTMVLETGETLGEVTEYVEYYTEGSTIAAGNLFGRRFVVQVFENGLRLLDGAKMTQELLIVSAEVENGGADVSRNLVIEATIADPFVLLKMTDGSLQLVVGDTESTKLTISQPPNFISATDTITACTLYQDKGPHCWLQRTCSETTSDRIQWPSTSDQGNVYCVLCRKSGRLEIYDLPLVTCVFSVDFFNHGMSVLWDQKVLERRANINAALKEGAEEDTAPGDAILRDAGLSLHVTQICFESWGEKFGRPFLLATLSDGTMLCYHAFSYEAIELSDALESGDASMRSLKDSPRLANLRFVRIPIDWVSGQEEGTKVVHETKFSSFKNVGSFPGVFVTGLRPTWLMVCRGRLRPHPQFSDGTILGFTPLHNVNCAHGFIYITAEGKLKICQLPSLLFYDNDWPVQKIPLRGTPHQITYHADVNLYALIISTPVSRPTAQVLMGDGHPFDQQQENSIGEDGQRLVTSEDYEVRVIEPAQPGGNWEAKAAIKMHMTENALTVRIVSLKNISTDQTQTLLAIGTSYVQGEDVAAKGRIILVSVGKDPQEPGSWAREVYSKELKGSISAIASLQGHLLVAIGPKIILHSWNGSELNGAAFFDAPLYVVSLNIVKNFILFGDIHKSIYFLCWKEDGAQLTLLAKDFGSLDCYATEFLIDGSTLSLLVSDSRKNLQIFSYAPKSMESWKGQKLLSRAEFHLGAHVNKFHRLQMLPTPGSARSNRYAVLFGTLDGAIDYLAPVDELTFRRLQTLQRKLVDCVSHVAGVNPRAFRQFRCDGKAHRPGPDNIVDCELLSHYDMLPLDEQLEIARQIGTTRAHVLSNLRDLALSTSFL